MTQDVVRMEPLTVSECWDRLRSHRVGRIGFDRGRGPRIHPVGYTVRGGDLLVTTARDSELGMFAALFADGGTVSFEVDEIQDGAVEQWSVLVGARVAGAEPGSPTARVAAAEGAVPPPDGHDEVVLRLVPVEVTGRRRVHERR
jgi:nitroimidazol reductase NimA-like FMN-containing flavoprotein (pyridoxamine 5'-phosphate oxidase superfamily)